MFSATAGATAYSITSLAWPRQVASPPNASRWVQTMRTITPSGFESVGTRMSAQPAERWSAPEYMPSRTDDELTIGYFERMQLP